MYYSDELYHHGIKGQRWGRRNGPPYPLSPQTHASVVRSAGRGGSTGSKSTKKGKIGGVKDHLLANSIFDNSDTGRESYKEYIKAAGKSAAGMAIGGAAGAGIGAGIAALRKGNTTQGMALGGVVGSSLGSLAGTRSYVKSLKLGLKRHKEIREADRAKKGRIGGMSPEEEKAARRKRILRNVAIGAGAAAALGGAGYLAYRNRDALVRYARTAGAKGRQGLTQARLGAKRVRYAAKDIGGRAAFKTARFYRNNPWAIPASALGAAAVGGTAYGIARSRRRKKRRSSRR